MNKIIHCEHWETGIELTIVANTLKNGEIEIKAILHKGEDILPIVGDDLLVDIELYCGDVLIN
jgi:hypothetical protein